MPLKQRRKVLILTHPACTTESKLVSEGLKLCVGPPDGFPVGEQDEADPVSKCCRVRELSVRFPEKPEAFRIVVLLAPVENHEPSRNIVLTSLVWDAQLTAGVAANCEDEGLSDI